MSAWRGVILACWVASGGSAFAFDGADKSPANPAPLDIFKNPHQALEAALESYRSGNPASSVEALKYAAAGGESLAKWKLGRMYADGDGVQRDDYKAYQYFAQIVDGYDEDNPNWREKSVVASAYVACGVFELNGIAGSKLKPDPDEALKLFFYAATNFGDPNAEYNLARLYMDGAAGLAKDNRQAARWLNLAAEKGHVESQALLGHMLFSGDGVPAQKARGLMWLTLAREGANARVKSSDKAQDKAQDWVRELYEADVKTASDTDRQAALVYLEDHVKQND